MPGTQDLDTVTGLPPPTRCFTWLHLQSTWASDKDLGICVHPQRCRRDPRGAAGSVGSSPGESRCSQGCEAGGSTPCSIRSPDALGNKPRSPPPAASPWQAVPSFIAGALGAPQQPRLHRDIPMRPTEPSTGRGQFCLSPHTASHSGRPPPLLTSHAHRADSAGNPTSYTSLLSPKLASKNYDRCISLHCLRGLDTTKLISNKLLFLLLNYWATILRDTQSYVEKLRFKFI